MKIFNRRICRQPSAFGLIGWLLSVACLVAVLCVTSSFAPMIRAQELDEDAAVATVLLYSGRPNPQFVLDDAALARLRTLINSADERESFDRQTVVPSILGYNGVMIQNLSRRGALAERIIVYRSDVEIRDKETRFRRDESRAIESFLLQQAVELGAIDRRALEVIDRQ